MWRGGIPWLRDCLAALLLAGMASAETMPPEEYQALSRELFRQLIEINTTDEDGSVTEAAEAMARRLQEAGFPDDDVVVLGPDPRKGNLVARLRGNEPRRKPILLLAHLDVVQALRKDWTLDPFTLTEKDGYFYGRGVTDDKDEAAIYVANFIRMKREGYLPERDIILALTADEEGGEHNGVEWLLENHRDLIDAELALNEGGGGALVDGRHLLNSVQLAEKVYQSFELEVTNRGGHSSLPREDNAIYELAAALLRIGEHHFPVRLNEVTRAFFERTAEIEEEEVADAMRALVRDPTDPPAEARLRRFPHYNARMRTTCVATRLEGGHADNALPQRATALVNCRMLPTDDPAEILATLKRLAGDAVGIRPRNAARPSPPSPLTPTVMEAIEWVTAEVWPGVPVIPTMSTGATDGLYLRSSGIPVYGVSGVFIDVDDVRAHGRDERLRVRSFFEAQEFLYRLVMALSGGAPN